MNIPKAREDEFGRSVSSGIYLNHAGVSPAPARVVRAVTDAMNLFGSEPVRCFIEVVLPAIALARRRLAALMGVPESQMALTKNTAHGLSIVADGLILDPGDNIVSVACEYPAVVYPWYAQKWRGVEVRLIQPAPDGTISPEAAGALIDRRTRAVTISWVQFATGYRADLAAWADLAHAHDALLIVDLIQGLGALPVDLGAANVDIAATGAHKWLMAPAGTGGLFITPAALDRLRPMNIGALSVENPFAFDPLKFDLKKSAQRYEEGSPNVLGLTGLAASLSLIEDVGIETIGARVLELTAAGAQMLEKKGYEVFSPRLAEEHAGILLFRHKEHSAEGLLDILSKNKIAAAPRGGGIRFSPHFYNTEEDLERAVAVLP